MARAALAVVFSQERDEEIAALRARMVEMQRRHEEELFDVRWRERLELARVMYRNDVNDTDDEPDDDAGEPVVMQYLVPLIEQARWGIGAATSGQFNFQRPGRVESTIMMHLCVAVSRDDPTRISEIMAGMEQAHGLPPGSIIRLPP